MDLSNIPDVFQSKIRLSIVAALMSGEKSFSELKETLELSDGNLSTHLSRLEESGCITVNKEFIAKKPRSSYALTSLGRDDFIDYVALLERIVNSIE